MRNYSRRRQSQPPKDSGSFWLCFSDMMSALVLVFMLVMFYCIYQYYDMMNLKEAEIAAQQAALTASEQDLESSRAELEASREELSVEQAKVLLAQSQLESYEALLAQQKEELDAAQAQLSSKEDELEDQRALYLAQQAELDAQQRQLDALVGVRTKIIQDLAEALEEADVHATVDKNSGAITLEASVLFETGMNELTDAGKRALDKFLPVYLSVLLSEENESNVSEIIIEGHTDSDGTYMNNLELSQKRAYAVLSYILSDEYTSINMTTKNKLRGIVTANGRSESQIVYDENGVEDKTASRRVEFKFRLQDEQMIENMRAILEKQEQN